MIIMLSTEQSREDFMEKVYKTMKGAGVFNLVLGILLIVFGITFGVLNIVNGGKLLKNRSNILF